MPAAFAAAEATSRGGQDLIEAYVVGLEVMAQVGRAMGMAHYDRGWHATATMGSLGAAAVAGSCSGSIASSFRMRWRWPPRSRVASVRTSGPRPSRLHAGQAAAAGIKSARLAALGATGDPTILEAPIGFFAMFSFGQACPDSLIERLGNPLDLIGSGLSVKQYPCCFATHRALDGVLDLRALSTSSAWSGGLASARITGPLHAFSPLFERRPTTGLEAKFSMAYTVGAALHDGSISLAAFTDEAVRRPELQRFLERVETIEDPSIQTVTSPIQDGYVVVLLRLADGRTLRRVVEKPRGSPSLPLSSAQIEQKFRDCASQVLAPSAIDRAALALLQLESQERLDSLISDLSGAVQPL